MGNEASFLSFFTQAGPIVRTVMLILLAASIVSWTLIFQRSGLIRRAKKCMAVFEQQFWSGENLNKLYETLAATQKTPEGMEYIFVAGFKEFLKLKETSGAQAAVVIEGIQRAMRVATTREIDRLENHLVFLATVGSTSPYVGLFGTVWGIMTSFQALGTVSQATISMVAPGISEALIATAMGLFAAIPAVVAYNRYSNQIDRIANQYQSFQEEFSNILARQIHEPIK